jgi:hypothetical protein
MLAILAMAACSEPGSEGPTPFEAEVAEYIELYPYQESFGVIQTYLQGDPGRVNSWVFGETPGLVRAGDGPVVLTSSAPSDDRFSSFQPMDDRNVNFRVVRPGRVRHRRSYTLSRALPHRRQRPLQICPQIVDRLESNR